MSWFKRSSVLSLAAAICALTTSLTAPSALADPSLLDKEHATFSLSALMRDLAPQDQNAEEGGAAEESDMSESMSDKPEVLWPGFLWGMQGFERMALPVSQPLYFEDPFIRTDFRFLYLHHAFPSDSVLRGGHVQTFALQIRLALTERLAFIATKDGYTNLRATILPDADGWNDFAVGLKYAIAYDIKDNEEWIFTGGMRWEWENGDYDILMGDSQELSPFLTYAHRWDKFNFMTAMTYRIPMDGGRANHSLLWDLHFSYEILENIYPLIEFHGIHYLSDADRIPLDIDGLDYTSFGGNDVSGNSLFWAGIGLRWHITDNISAGATYEFPLQDPDSDMFDHRVTVNIAYRL